MPNIYNVSSTIRASLDTKVAEIFSGSKPAHADLRPPKEDDEFYEFLQWSLPTTTDNTSRFVERLTVRSSIAIFTLQDSGLWTYKPTSLMLVYNCGVMVERKFTGARALEVALTENHLISGYFFGPALDEIHTKIKPIQAKAA